LATLGLAITATFDATAQTRLRRVPGQSAITKPRPDASGEREFVAVTDAMLKNPADGDWLMWRRTLNGWGYSPLDEINKRNVDRLEQVWAYPLGMGIQESTPLVHDGVMYVPNSGDYVQAFDAATGSLLWEYKRQYPEGVRG